MYLQGGLYSMTIRTTPLKASFRFMCSSLLRQDPTISWEAWFTIPSPCFYRAWLCKWSWWRPQPRVTESSGIIADLQCLLKSFGHTCVFSTCPWRGLPEASAEFRMPSPALSHKKRFFSSELMFPHPRPHDPGGPIRMWLPLLGTWQSQVLVHLQSSCEISWGRERGQEKEKWLWVTLVRSTTANHTQDWFSTHCSAHSFFISYFSLPTSLFHQGQGKGMHTTLRFIINRVTRLSWGANGLLKLPLYGWTWGRESHEEEAGKKRLSPSGTVGPSWSPLSHVK